MNESLAVLLLITPSSVKLPAVECDLFSETASFFFSNLTSSGGDDGSMLPGGGDISAEA